MALTLIPLNQAPAPTPAAVPPPRNGRPDGALPLLPFDYEALPSDHPVQVPVLLIQLQDDLSRSRLREAFWISLVAHLLIIIAVVLGPKYLPMHRVAVRSAEDLLRERQATFLALPPDEQKVTARPNSKFISDKDRIATSRAPQIDRKTLDELRDARRPGPPQPPGMPTQPAAPEMAQAAPQQAPNAGRGAQTPPTPEEARLRTPAMTAKLPHGHALAAWGDITQLLLLLAASIVMTANAVSERGQTRLFDRHS